MAVVCILLTFEGSVLYICSFSVCFFLISVYLRFTIIYIVRENIGYNCFMLPLQFRYALKYY